MSKKKRRKQRHRRNPEHRHSQRTAGHHPALSELVHLAASNPQQILEVEILPQEDVATVARVRLSTKGIKTVAGGLPISDEYEDVLIGVGSNFPDMPPAVGVSHSRFAGHTHVLKGSVLCIYLDPTREWHPSFGMSHVLERLWDWFEDAANNRFDSRSALFHVFGGVPPATVASPTVVLRHPPPNDHRPLSLASLRQRTNSRVDVIGWRKGRASPPDLSALVIGVKDILPFGLGNDLATLTNQVSQAGGPDLPLVREALQRGVLALQKDDPFHVILAVQHPAHKMVHLAVGRIRSDVAEELRLQPDQPILQELPISWLPTSDERPEISTRRDVSRPASAFQGKDVEVWGCGGLGSWIAEFIVRAGARSIVLRDLAPVSGGILIRQNYVETDVGKSKVGQLANRLSAISDNVEVIPELGSALRALEDGGIPKCDVIVDATINETVAARLDEAARKMARQEVVLSQVATDPRTATMGMLVLAQGLQIGPATIDRQVGGVVLKDGELERFHGFWTPATKSDQLIPAAGCSVPTFHGSAADVAVIAGSLINLIGQHILSKTSGTHLLAAPGASSRGPSHRFIPYDQGEVTNSSIS